MVLETERLFLDVWRASDWTALAPIAADPEVMRYVTGGTPWTEAQVQSFVDRQVRLYAERGFCRWKLLAKPGGEVAGFCGVGFWRDAPDPEIGWWLARRYWGRGLATEAARAALDDAFRRAALKRIISVAMPENKASTRIMEKLGLQLEREFVNEGVRLVRYSLDLPTYEAAAPVRLTSAMTARKESSAKPLSNVRGSVPGRER